jgi:hypothetical protein
MRHRLGLLVERGGILLIRRGRSADWYARDEQQREAGYDATRVREA